ncbi:MAG: hypothetical protein K9N34_03625 [Candidatus Marinimicrobia bacterium]|nr:hypothetical protein [Candidatus Neomarinimicrobiota bacterium]MCF7839784.1 hypothetical protein [Candidatus Neomarinimicrobiota bacterium]
MARPRITLDFTDFFRKEAPRLIGQYKRLLTVKRGIANDAAPPNAPRTIRKKGKDHWLVDTGETHDRGFDYRVQPKRLLIFASGKRHSGRYTQMLVPEGSKRQKGQSRIPSRKVIRQRPGTPPTYRQIFRWHNKKGYSGIFGKLPIKSAFYRRMQAEANRQTRDQFPKRYAGKIKIWMKS